MKKNILLSVGLFLLAGMILHAQSKQGLYVGDAFQGEMDLYDSLDWIAANAQDGGEYSIVLGTSIAVSSSVLDYSGKSVTVSLKSSGETLQVSYATRSPSSSLFTVKAGVTFVLEKGVELVGRPSASRPPVTVDGGNFIMNGGAVKDSTVDHDNTWFGGGVDLLRGTFTMNDGIISGNVAGSGAGVTVGENTTFTMNGGIITGNSAGDYFNGSFGGGVFVEKNAKFTMNGGTINSNSAAHGNGYGGGGGVYVGSNGTFEMKGGVIAKNVANKNATGGGGVFVDGKFMMNDGTISGNSTTKSGGGVLVDGGTFTKSNTAGVIYGGDAADDKANKADQYGHAVHTKNGSRDTTARVTMALDSRKQGAEGGWE